MAARSKLSFILLIFILPSAQSYICYYSNFTTKIDSPLYPLDPYGMSGRFTGLWSNDTRDGTSYQLWMLSYDAATPKSFFLALIAMRNPSRPWDLTLPVVLWKARQTRFVGINTTLAITTDGDLKLDEDGDVVWSTNTSNKGVRRVCISNSATVMLTDESENHVIWQSSDEPADTVLVRRALPPGTKLISWNSSGDPRDGLYSLEMERSVNRLTLSYDSQPYWRSAESVEEGTFAVFCREQNGAVSLQLRNDTMDIGLAGIVSPENCSSPNPNDQVMPLPINGSLFTNSTFVRIMPDGDLVLYSWNFTGTNWITYFNFSSMFKCFLPLSCGRYRTCNITTGACEETCPGNFVKAGEDCEPAHALEVCTDELEYRFIRQEGVDYFSTNYTTPVVAESEEDCQELCNSNCNCTAAFFSSGSERCYLTHGSVQSLRTGQFVALLKVAQPRRMITRRQFQAMTLGILVPALLLLVLCLGWQYWRTRKVVVDDEGEEESTLQLSLMPGMPRRYTYQELEEVTSNFSETLGTGGFGSVFKGMLSDGTEVAVKKLEGSNQKSRDFFAEVGILARTHHWNLVKLLGYCAQGPRKRLLVYEYMKNGSLEQWIFQDKTVLSWKMRFNIALGTARGLSYLHDECAERIIHLDLKPENVLLNNGFEPKIADFGLSKLMDREESHLQLTVMRGTPGYVAPECLQEGTVTEKSDVFSFGVLLLEIVTCCKNRGLSSGYLKENLFGNGDRVGALHSQQREDDNVLEKRKLQSIAALCIQDDPESRPPMSKVVQMMEGVIQLPQAPSESQMHFFLAGRSKQTSDTASDSGDRSFHKLLQNASASGLFAAFDNPDAR